MSGHNGGYHGGPGGPGGGGAPGSDPSMGGGSHGGTSGMSNGVGTRKAVTSITKSISYVASGTKSNQVLAIAGTDSDSVTTADAPRAISIRNTGRFPVVAMIGYEAYTDEDTDNVVIYLHTLLLPGESIWPNMRGIISLQSDTPTQDVGDDSATLADALALSQFSNATLWNLDGEVVDYTAPSTTLLADSNTELGVDEGGDSVLNSTTATNLWLPEAEWTSATNGPALRFRFGDLIRVGDEIMEVTAVGSGADGTINNYLTVKRGLYGSTAATHVAADTIYFPFFNEYYDYDRVLSGNTQLVQTDNLGRWKSSNFFGYGRVSTTPPGLVPGSVCIRFWSSAYQEVTMGGATSNIPITSSTNSKLAVSTEYTMRITIDDSAATDFTFTTDSSNVNFGGTNGVIQKIQTALDTETRTNDGDLYGYSCTVGIVGGKLRFTSNSHLIPHDGTNGSQILIANGGSGEPLFDGDNGIFPAIATVNAPVKPEVPDLNVYDPITYAKSPNINGICYDNSYGRLIGAANGTISYETGAISLTGAPPNANFEVSVVHNSPLGGSLGANKEDANTLKSIHANVLNKNMDGKLEVNTY